MQDKAKAARVARLMERATKLSQHGTVYRRLSEAVFENVPASQVQAAGLSTTAHTVRPAEPQSLMYRSYGL